MQPERARRQASRDVERRPARADFAEYRRTRDPRLRDRLVEAHVDLAYSIARRFEGRGEELEELKQVALLGLVHAVERFDPSRGLAFSTFATPTITGTLKRHFRDRTWAIRPPRQVQERYLEANVAVESLTGELGRVPTVMEIAAYGNWSEPQVHDALAVGTRRHCEHWDTAEGRGVREPGAIDSGLSGVEDRRLIDDLLGDLGAGEREIVKMRFFEDLTQTAIGRRVGVSQMHVSRVLATSLDSLRATVVGRGEYPAARS
jgi:RNA polymerase sigma-B factor